MFKLTKINLNLIGKFVCSAVRTNECKPFLNFDLARFKEDHFKKRRNFQDRLLQTLKSSKEDRRWCVDCSLLVLAHEQHEHEDHLIKDNLTKNQLRMPTKLLSAYVENKEAAQYLFSDESLKLVLKTIIKCKFTHIICIGCPSLHEQLIVRSKKYQVQSFLLDIDSRYLQFYTSKQYLCFNMANSYLFEKDKYEVNLNNFITASSKLLVITDPPFGLMVPALADTLIKLKKKIVYLKRDAEQFQMNSMLFHLYFYEKRILDAMPELKMMDYKISYSNHKKLKQDNNSIARLFTDIDGSQIVLKGLDDYKFCEHCERWVHAIAKHCFECKNCMAKDGTESEHCALCDKCFKLTWEHCFTCEICTRKGECKCGGNLNNKLESEEYNYLDDSEMAFKDKDDVDNRKESDGEEDGEKSNEESFKMNERINGFQKNYSNRSFNFKDRQSFNNGNRERSFANKDRDFNRRGGSYGNKDRDFNHKGGRSFNHRGGSFGNKDRDFNHRGGSFGNKDRDFNHKSFGSFKRGSEITTDDFNKMFFNKGRNGFKDKSSKDRNSFGRSKNGFKRSQSAFGDRSFKRKRFDN